jgi:anti-anti-sigma factor
MVTIENKGNKVQAAFKGRMDALSTPQVSEFLESDPAVQGRNPENELVFDLTEVDYIASSFIRLCVNYARKAGPGGFAITNCQPFVKKTFKISGLDEILNIR